MPNYSKKTTLQLRKSLLELEAEIEARLPEVAAEIRLIKRLLDARGAETDSHVYKNMKSPWDAITLCLQIAGDFELTQKEMVDAIIAGGYIAPSPNAARSLMNTSIAYHLDPKRGNNLVEKGGKIGLHP